MKSLSLSVVGDTDVPAIENIRDGIKLAIQLDIEIVVKIVIDVIVTPTSDSWDILENYKNQLECEYESN